ncbi:bifunctional riboflavin kinase/FAD synthetase [Telmatospirillum sp.]|uniref:bifunctional riboflavin kinase/FAD synthetase n=1 Tax=Telmatospirillum sp. TaxID=2079197 RepID=UPI0028415950|nr:bifunctional riboflavin kinase/FAD synthetase [Telmatospirillum sp.]MDR3435894.1 bifunctional riboflavin kinase/FAD synthetase [Telmatospirillum sp.]
MRILRHYVEFPAELRGGAVALGNFDGVHLGHQTVIGAAQRLANAHGGACGVMSFEPHPRELFSPSSVNYRLTPFRIKARLIGSLGLDFLLMQRFDREFASHTAIEFVEKVLVAGLGVRHVVVGYDYVFGKGRGGNVELLRDLAGKSGFDVTCVDPVEADDGALYSSTRIREALTAGRPREAARLLGRFWEIEGRVEHGDERGRTIGFPTANVELAEYLHPATGVYAVIAGIDRGGDTEWLPGVANFGKRPTFDKQDVLLEVHLFDFTGDLYGRHLRVGLVDYLRPERKFSGLDELKTQIEEDCRAARKALAAVQAR